MSTKVANNASHDHATFNPGAACLNFLEEESKAKSGPPRTRTSASSRRSSNRRQPWIDARKLSDEQKQRRIEAEIQRKSRRSSVRVAWEDVVDLFSKTPSNNTSRATSRDDGEVAPDFVRAMAGDEEYKPPRRTVLNDRRRSLVHGLSPLHKHDSLISSSSDRGVLSKYSGGRDRDSKIPRKESYVRTSVPNALLPSNEHDRNWARQVLRHYSSTIDVAQCDIFTWHAIERADDPVHLVIFQGEMIFMDQYGKNLPDQPSLRDQLDVVYNRGYTQPDYDEYDVPLTKIPTQQVDQDVANHFKSILERNGSEYIQPPSAVRVGWWLHNSPVYRVKYREAEIWMTIDGRNMPNRPAISDQIWQLRYAAREAAEDDDDSSGNVSPTRPVEVITPASTAPTTTGVKGPNKRSASTTPTPAVVKGPKNRSNRDGKRGFGRVLHWLGVR